MALKKRNFYAYQIDLHYQDNTNQVPVDAVKWDGEIVAEIFKYIIDLPMQLRTKKYHDSWLFYLDHLDIDEHFIFGRFCSANYGTKGELIHADNLSLRPNPKEVREGETESTYFLIRKSDGLLLLQGNLRLVRNKLDEYIEHFGGEVISRYNLSFVQVCTLVNESFFNSIASLNTVNKLEIEVTAKEETADENEAVRALRNEAEEIRATNVKLEFSAKYQRSGIFNVLPLVRKYKSQPGITKIVVRGKVAGAEKVIKMSDSQEKYSPKLEMDANNQPMLSSVEQALRNIANSREKLRG